MACANFWRLEEQVRKLEKAKVDILHCDIMDADNDSIVVTLEEPIKIDK